MKSLKITVVTVCYNAVDGIEETMLSVLNQTYPNIEYIIIDGGSTDGSVDIIKKYADRLDYWVSEPDRGIYDAMNKGIEKATGDYINFMNAGDQFVSDNVIECFVNENPTEDIVYGDTIFNYEYGYLKVPAPNFKVINERLPYCHQSSFVRIDAHKLHLFDLSFKYCADYKFCYDSYYKFNMTIRHLPFFVALYEASEGVSSRQKRKSFKEKYRIWAIGNHPLKKIYYDVKLNIICFRDFLRRHLPSKIVLSIQEHRAKNRAD